MQQPDITAWMDRVRVQLDPSPPVQKREHEWALLGGIAAGILLLLSGSIYWLASTSAKKDEPELVVVRGNSMRADAPALPTRASPPPRETPRNRAPVQEARVPRVTEEAPTLPVEIVSNSAQLAAASTEARATAAALPEKEPQRTSTASTRIADTKAPAERTQESKVEEPAVRREPAATSVRPQPAKAPATKLAMAEPAAAPMPIQSSTVAPAPSVPEAVIEMPKLKSMRAPDYPVSAMRAGHTGTTTLELLVLENGLVGEATVMSSSGYPKLDAAAVAVAKRSWKFFPGTKDGKPMPMKIEAPVRFSMD